MKLEEEFDGKAESQTTPQTLTIWQIKGGNPPFAPEIGHLIENYEKDLRPSAGFCMRHSTVYSKNPAHEKLIPSRPPRSLNQPFSGEPEVGGTSMNATTRRKFLKRSGGASVAAMVAWTLATKDAGAEDEGDNSSKGSGCPQKTTRTNHGTFTLRRVDIWRRHPNTKNGSSFYLRTAGVPTVIAGSQPPGAFPDEISFVKNGKICNYVKESTAPVIVSNPQTPNWVFSSGNHPGPSYSGDALPNPAADWQGENVVVQATYSASQAWSATQSSILQ